MSQKNKQSPLEKYKETYSYNLLLQKHDLNETGIWKVRGEDDNAELAGPHYMPELGLFEGKLQDIISYAVTIPRFWTWGGGGDITKVAAPTKIDAQSTFNYIAAHEKVTRLEQQLKQAKQELESHNV